MFRDFAVKDQENCLLPHRYRRRPPECYAHHQDVSPSRGQNAFLFEDSLQRMNSFFLAYGAFFAI